MRIAVLADIHGNLPALEAVIDKLEVLQPDHVVLDGDLINAVPFSSEVVERVRQLAWVVVRGNHEFYYLDMGTERAAQGSEDPSRWGQLHWLAEKITPEQGAYLAMLPDERTLYLSGTRPIRVAHGVPGRNRVGFYGEQPAESIAAEVGDIAEGTVVSAHTHVQVDRHVYADRSAVKDFYSDPHSSGVRQDGEGIRHWHVVNPGSVGLPLNGEPTAQFAILESVPEAVEAGGWRATHYGAEYDRRPALASYHDTGMLEAGGVITQLFYWELVTAQPEIIRFYHWAREHGHDPDRDLEESFHAYAEATGRGRFVDERDPLRNDAHSL